MVIDEVLDTGHAVQVAERLEENNPDWVIMYGTYSREFVAFPVYPDAPENCYCSAKDPAALAGHIRETERRHGRIRLARHRGWLPAQAGSEEASAGADTSLALSYPKAGDGRREYRHPVIYTGHGT